MNVKVSDNVKNLKENVYDWHNRYLEILRKQKEHTIMNVLGYNFQHAMNGGEYHIKELGYWLDGYDEDKNTVIEFFENNHWHRKNKNKDLNRGKEIVDFLGCEFIILREQIGGIYLPEYFLR